MSASRREALRVQIQVIWVVWVILRLLLMRGASGRSKALILWIIVNPYPYLLSRW